MRLRLLFLSLSVAGACAVLGLRSAQPASFSETVRAMHSRYHSKWPQAFTFTQQNLDQKAPGQPAEESWWYEAISYPGHLRIDMNTPNKGRAIVFANDSIFQYSDRQLMRMGPRPNALMRWAGDVYFLHPDSTVAWLGRQGWNTRSFYTTTWKGRPVLVCGATSAADSLVQQAWIDAEHLYLVRLIESDGNGHRFDTHMNAHKPLGKGWTETEVHFFVDGQLLKSEYYSNIQLRSKLNPAIFRGKELAPMPE